MSIGAKIIKEYNNDLLSDARVRSLLASVVQDPQNETVNFEESAYSVRNGTKLIDNGEVRRKIIGWLNLVWFSRESLSTEWWFEMHTRLQKLLIVSMILEGDNLRSMGATPDKSDIPQCLVGIKYELDYRKEADFPELMEKFKQRISLVEKEEEGKAFINLYTTTIK